MIQAEHLQKTFRVRKRNAGFKNAAKAFFSREYEEIHALNDVSFRIEDGEAVGYIGPNGAGKSSTIKILSGILTPDSGTCVIDGRVPWKDRRAHVSQIGVVFGQRSQLWWDVPVIDSFELIRDIYAVTEDVYKRNLRDLTDLLNLSELLKTPTRSLSLGQRMRCEIAASLLHDPRILFLDEPTSGLDPESAQNVNMLIQELATGGTTIFLCTHQLRYAQEICTTYGLMSKGSLFATGNIEKLRSMVTDKVKVRVKASCIPKDMEYEKIEEHTYDISVNSEDEIPLIVKRIVGAGGDIYQVSTEKMSLEEIYFSLIDRNHGEMERGNL